MQNALRDYLDRGQKHDAGLVGAVPADREAVGKQVISAEYFIVQGAVVSGGIRQELGDAVAGGGGYAAQGDAGVLVCVGALGGVGQQEGLGAVCIEQGAIRPLVRGDKAVEVSQLGEGAQAVRKGNALLVFGFIRRGEGAGVQFQPEATCQGDIEAEFDGGGAPCVEVGAGGDMAANGIGGEDVGGCPLHAEAVVRVGVVAEPEFLVQGSGGGIHAPAAGRAALEGDLGVLCAEETHVTVVAADVVEGEVALQFRRAVGRAGIGYFAVAIPFDVGDAGVFCQQAVNGGGDISGGDIEYELVAFCAWGDAM